MSARRKESVVVCPSVHQLGSSLLYILLYIRRSNPFAPPFAVVPDVGNGGEPEHRKKRPEKNKPGKKGRDPFIEIQIVIQLFTLRSNKKIFENVAFYPQKQRVTSNLRPWGRKPSHKSCSLSDNQESVDTSSQVSA